MKKLAIVFLILVNSHLNAQDVEVAGKVIVCNVFFIFPFLFA